MDRREYQETIKLYKKMGFKPPSEGVKMEEDKLKTIRERQKNSKMRTIEKRNNRRLSERSGYYLIDKSYNVREGHCKMSRQRNLEHELAKAKVMKLLMDIGYKTYSEVILTNKCIADVYLPEKLRIYEIRSSESIKEFNEKIRNYPEELEIIPLEAKKVLDKGFKL